MKRKIRTLYAERVEVLTINNKPSMTSQEFKNDTNIYSILRKYGINADMSTAADWKTLYDVVPGANPDTFVYTDYDKDLDYQYYQDRILKVKNDFLALPSSVRQLFGHDVAAFHKFVSDPSNYDTCVNLGILPNKPVVLPEVDVPPVVETPKVPPVEEKKEG